MIEGLITSFISVQKNPGIQERKSQLLLTEH